MSGRRFLLATRSVGKLRELREIFSGFGLDVVDLSGLGIPETAAEDDLEQYDTFEENALAKTRYFLSCRAASRRSVTIPAWSSMPWAVNRASIASAGRDERISPGERSTMPTTPSLSRE